MKKLFALVLALSIFIFPGFCEVASALSQPPKYYTVYSGEDKKEVLFLKGEDINEGDMYLSHENNLYKIKSVDDKNKTAIAEFIRKENLPKCNYKSKANSSAAVAASKKKVGIYHTHYDES